MSETEKLQRAIELTVAAGYQIDRDAFEFLNLISSTQDPAEIMHKAIHELDNLREKPLFIDKKFLEKLVPPLIPNKEITAQSMAEPLQTLPEPQITEGKKPFHVCAKEVDSDIKILDDPAEKLNSSGTIEDYVRYFRDRFKRMEKLLRQRVDVRSAASVIDALKSPANARLKIIVIITEKRESQNRIVLTVEDLHASATVLVPQNASEGLSEKARLLLLDQVVCLSVVKTRGSLLIVEDIVLPDIPQRTPHKAPIPVYAVLTSDIHVGSTKFQKDAFNRFILWLNGKYGDEKMRELAGHVKYVLVAGDIVDGIGIYPNQVKELLVKDAYEQYKLAAKFIEQIPDYIEVIIVPGNHDAPRKALPQPAISNAFLELLEESRNIHSYGNPCLASIHGVEVLMYHGRSLDDVISTVPGMSFNHPEKAMKLLLQSRHLAPVYGGKTMLSAEGSDFLAIEHVPDIFHAGHIHVLGSCNYRGVSIVNSGAWQDQTDYMRRLGLVPTPGQVPLVNLQTLEISTIPFA
jgi:DNA polymerase II small subunit